MVTILGTETNTLVVLMVVSFVWPPYTLDVYFGPYILSFDNPRSKYRSDLGVSLKSDYPTTHPTPKKVFNKQDRVIQPKQKLSVCFNTILNPTLTQNTVPKGPSNTEFRNTEVPRQYNLF